MSWLLSFWELMEVWLSWPWQFRKGRLFGERSAYWPYFWRVAHSFTRSNSSCLSAKEQNISNDLLNGAQVWRRASLTGHTLACVVGSLFCLEGERNRARHPHRPPSCGVKRERKSGKFSLRPGKFVLLCYVCVYLLEFNLSYTFDGPAKIYSFFPAVTF